MARPVIASYERVVGIDPGLGGTGYAEWRPNDRTGTLNPRPRRVGVLRDRAKDDDLTNRCAELAERLLDRLGNNVASTVAVIEFPQHMTNRAGIAAQAGSVYKLTFLVGFLASAFHAGSAHVHVVTPQEWKGQLPKDIVQQRVQRALGGAAVCTRLGLKSHAWDAAGIGLWALGRF